MCYSCYINKLAPIHKIIDCKKIYNIFNTFSIIEEDLVHSNANDLVHSNANDLVHSNANDLLHTFAIFDEHFKYSNEGIAQLLELSSKYNSNFCIIHNQCNLYDNFRLKIDYTLLYMEKLYNCKIDTNRILDNDYIKYGKFPYYCSLYQNGIYTKIKIIKIE
jgi:hypothetical protein